MYRVVQIGIFLSEVTGGPVIDKANNNKENHISLSLTVFELQGICKSDIEKCSVD